MNSLLNFIRKTFPYFALKDSKNGLDGHFDDHSEGSKFEIDMNSENSMESLYDLETPEEGLLSLPNEILIEIILHFTVQEIENILMLVSKSFYVNASSPYIWQSKLFHFVHPDFIKESPVVIGHCGGLTHIQFMIERGYFFGKNVDVLMARRVVNLWKNKYALYYYIDAINRCEDLQVANVYLYHSENTRGLNNESFGHFIRESNENMKNPKKIVIKRKDDEYQNCKRYYDNIRLKLWVTKSNLQSRPRSLKVRIPHMHCRIRSIQTRNVWSVDGEVSISHEMFKKIETKVNSEIQWFERSKFHLRPDKHVKNKVQRDVDNILRNTMSNSLALPIRRSSFARRYVNKPMSLNDYFKRSFDLTQTWVNAGSYFNRRKNPYTANSIVNGRNRLYFSKVNRDVIIVEGNFRMKVKTKKRNPFFTIIPTKISHFEDVQKRPFPLNVTSDNEGKMNYNDHRNMFNVNSNSRMKNDLVGKLVKLKGRVTSCTPYGVRIKCSMDDHENDKKKDGIGNVLFGNDNRNRNYTRTKWYTIKGIPHFFRNRIEMNDDYERRIENASNLSYSIVKEEMQDKSGISLFKRLVLNEDDVIEVNGRFLSTNMNTLVAKSVLLRKQSSFIRVGEVFAGLLSLGFFAGSVLLFRKLKFPKRAVNKKVWDFYVESFRHWKNPISFVARQTLGMGAIVTNLYASLASATFKWGVLGTGILTASGGMTFFYGNVVRMINRHNQNNMKIEGKDNQVRMML